MSHNAANEEKLGALHAKVTERFLKLVKTTEDHRLLNAAAKFLADNKITATPYEGETLSELDAQLRSRERKFGNIAKEARESASDSIH